MAAKFKVVPVRRRNGTSGPWIMCAEHRAQSWAVGCFRRGERVLFIVRFDTKGRAQEAVQGVERLFAGPTRGYRLGARMGART